MRYMTVKVALVVLGSNPSLHYKIIRLSLPKRWSLGFSILRCEIFDSAIWAWKESADIVLPYGEALMLHCPVIYVSGSLYYLTTNDRVLAFDENSESYHLFEIPRPAFGNYEYRDKKLLKYEGKLGFAYKAPDGCLELWVMKKCENEHLSERRLVLTAEVLKEDGAYYSFNSFANSDVALVENYDCMVNYNVKNCEVNVVKLDH